MLSTIRKRKQQEGFTIIEVLIVLAIAGLILVIVFLAVPALQRNARNQQRKTDVSNLLAGVNEFVNDNQGTLPDTVAIAADGTTTFSLAAGGASSVQGAKVGFYKTTANVTITSTVSNTAPASSPTDKVVIITGATCSSNTAVAGSARSFVATYWIEPGTIEQCQGS
ncbi:MAG TPA: type II secretion system protein [Candidatus Saccharimonadales bacterium]|nr:type II secretion system protein [Candidatus Saccharimonadales bacterium]